MTTRVIDTEGERDMLLRWLKGMAAPFTVDVVKGRRRSVEQNKLQRLWCREIAEQLGDHTAEQVRAYCKLHIGVPILREESTDFREKYDRIIRPLAYEQKLELMAEPFDFPVTRLMKTEQKTRYLDAIHKHFTEQGLKLTDPEQHGRAA